MALDEQEILRRLAVLESPGLAPVATGLDSGWCPVAFAANWSDFAAGEALCAWRRLANGLVLLEGLAKKGVALALPDVIFTLPNAPGVRPATEKMMGCASLGGYAEIRIHPNGTVYLQAGGSAVGTSVAGCIYDPAR